MQNNNKNKIRNGAALEHGAAHAQDHKQWSRRDFLRGLGLTGGAFMLGGTALNAVGASPLAYLLNESVEDRILVMIRLQGGNDGLNTFVPLYDYGTYQSNRPQIALPQNSLVGLSPEFGMHNAMSALSTMWQEGQMKVVNSVGYDNHSLSHFRGSDIWHSASDADVVDNSGWLGRFLENEYPDYLTNPPEVPPAVQIGSIGNLLFNGSDENNTSYAVSVTDPNQLFEIAQTGQLYSLDNLPECYIGEQLGYLRTVANNTLQYATIINESYENSETQAAYPAARLGQQLELVARLIKGGLGTKMYVVTLNGFDTHAGQLNNHQSLLNDLAESVNAFFTDLEIGGRAQDVLAMTYSEFGRRVNQNASQGTDHGTAAPVMLFGEGLNGNGFLGTNPDLQNLDNNSNLMHGTDFREIYASVLENWLCIDGDLVDNILGQSFERMDLGLSCMAVSTSSPAEVAFRHEARYSPTGEVTIHYTLTQATDVRVEVFNILGQPMALLYQGRQIPGEYAYRFEGGSRYAPSSYIYRIEANGQTYSRQMMVGM